MIGKIIRNTEAVVLLFLILLSPASSHAQSTKQQLEELKKQKSRKLANEIAEAEKLAAVLSEINLEIKAKAADDVKLFGSVTSGTIHEALLHLGHNIDKKQIVLDEPIKEIGEKAVEIRLAGNVKAQIKVNVIKED